MAIRCKETQMEELQTQNIFGFQKFISSILSNLKKFDEFNDEIIFHIRPKMAEISPDSWVQRHPGIGKTL